MSADEGPAKRESGRPVAEDFDAEIADIQHASGRTDDVLVRICRRILRLAIPVSLVTAGVALLWGWAAAGRRGLDAAAGAMVVALLFCLATPLSFLVVSRLRPVRRARRPFQAFTAVVMTLEALKFLVCFALLRWMGSLGWFDRTVFLWSVLAGVLAVLTSELLTVLLYSHRKN